MTLPPNKIWTQNRSDVLGSMAASFNLNLTEELGKTKVSPRTIITTNGITNFGTPVAFREYNGNNYAMAPAATPSTVGLFSTTGELLKTPFVQSVINGVGGTSFSSDYSDMEVFYAGLILTGSSTKFLYGDDSVLAASADVLTANVNHKLLNSVTNNKCYIFSSLIKIISINTVDFSVNSSGSYTFTFSNTIPNAHGIFLVSMLEANGLIWILVANTKYGSVSVYTWDGITANTFQNAYPIYSRGALAGIVKDGTPYIMDADGQLRYFNGAAFIPAPNGKLPIRNNAYLTNPISQKNDRWIHPNGMMLENNRINILVNNLNNDNAGTINEDLPSGIWEYDPEIGWYHKYALTQCDYSGAAAVTDYGQNRLARVGSLQNLRRDATTATTVGTFMAGADYYTTASATKSASWTNDSLDLIQKSGYLVTSKIFSPNIQDTFNKMYIRMKPFLASTDRIYLKYRTTDSPPVEVTATWIDATSFTTPTSAISGFATDDEVEGTAGGGSGMASNIVSITDNAGTSTVVLSNTLGTSAVATSKVRFQHWKLAGTWSTQGTSLAEFNIGKTAPWIQFKVIMLYTGDNEIYDLKPDQSKER